MLDRKTPTFVLGIVSSAATLDTHAIRLYSSRMSAVLTYPDIVSQRPHWLAGVGGFELTNVAYCLTTAYQVFPARVLNCFHDGREEFFCIRVRVRHVNFGDNVAIGLSLGLKALHRHGTERETPYRPILKPRCPRCVSLSAQ